MSYRLDSLIDDLTIFSSVFLFRCRTFMYEIIIIKYSEKTQNERTVHIVKRILPGHIKYAKYTCYWFLYHLP